MAVGMLWQESSADLVRSELADGLLLVTGYVEEEPPPEPPPGTDPPVPPDGPNYYVAKNGDDGNDGSLANPWKTISHACSQLQAGDVLYIREGVYNELIEPARDGEAGNEIWYIAYENETVQVAGKSGQNRTVDLRNRSHIIIIGIDVSYAHGWSSGNWNFWVEMNSASEYNQLWNLTAIREGDPLALYKEGNKEAAINIIGGKGHVVANCFIRGMRIGIHYSECPRLCIIKHNTIRETGGNNIDNSSGQSTMAGMLIENNILELSATSDGIQFQEDTDLPSGSQERQQDTSNWGTIVRGNVIRGHAENGVDLKGARHVFIDGNTIYGTIGSSNGPLEGWNREASGAISCGTDRSSRDNVVRRNIIYDCHGGVTSYSAYSAQGMKIYNNTLLANNRDYEGPDSDYENSTKVEFHGPRERSSTDDLAVVNNIIICHNSAEVGLRTRSGSSNPIYMDYNLYYNDRNTPVFGDGYGPWVAYTGLTAWRNRLADGRSVVGDNGGAPEGNSMVANPLFVNATLRPTGDYTEYDFNLQLGSPAVNAGGPLTRTVGAGSSSLIVTLADARFFTDGMGITDGDSVVIGSNAVTIVGIDYDTNKITVDSPISWSNNDPVYLEYEGTAPDIGAFEHGSIGRLGAASRRYRTGVGARATAYVKAASPG